jgi:uncharacterized protein YkwD
MKRLVALVVGTAALLSLTTGATPVVPAAPPTLAAAATADTGTDEQQFLAKTNASRAAADLGPLTADGAAANVARPWSDHMASAGVLSHNPDVAEQVTALVTDQWKRVGENVGYGGDVPTLHDAFMNSPAHRDNVLGDYNRVGIGAVRSGASLWVTFVFIKGPAIAPPPAPVANGVGWFLRNALTSGVADTSFTYGAPGDLAVTCDWYGDGIDSPGIYRNGTFHLRGSNSSGVADASFPYGDPGDLPVCGDWDGNGSETVGIYRFGWFFLKNQNGPGNADAAFFYGDPTDYPVAGDWNGDGTDTVGIYRQGAFFLRNLNTPGVADTSFGYGDPTDRPAVGDWDGDGDDTAGIFRGGSLFLRNTNTLGIADKNFLYGDPTDQPLAGDWDKDGSDSLGIVRTV